MPKCHSEADGHPWIYAVAVALRTCWSTRADGSIVHQRELGRAPPWMAMSRRLLSFSKPWYLVTHRGQFHPSGWEAFGVGYMWRRLQCAIMLLAATRFRSVVVIAVGRLFYMWLALKGIASPRPLQPHLPHLPHIPFCLAFTPFTPWEGIYPVYPLLLDLPRLPHIPLPGAFTPFTPYTPIPLRRGKRAAAPVGPGGGLGLCPPPPVRQCLASGSVSQRTERGKRVARSLASHQ